MAGMEIFGWLSATLVLGGLIFWKEKLNLKRPLLTKIDWVLFALFAVVVASAFFAAPDASDKVDIIGSARFVFLFVLLRLGIEIVDPKRAEKLMPYLIGITAIVGIFAIQQNMTGIDLLRGARNPIQKDYFGDDVTYRARGLWNHPVRFGHSIALSLCVPLAYFLSGLIFSEKSNHRRRVLWTVSVAALLLGGAGLFFSYTRGAWIGFAAAVVGMSLYAGWRIASRVMLAGALALAIGVAVTPNLQNRFKSFLKLQTDGSSVARLDIWHANIEMFKDHPVLGVGYGINEDLIGEYYTKLGINQVDRGHAHNNFLQFLSGTGILGFSTFVVFVVMMLWMTHLFIRRAQKIGDPFLLAVGLSAIGYQLVMHVGGLTECSFKSAQITHEYFLLLALLIALNRSGAMVESKK